MSQIEMFAAVKEEYHNFIMGKKEIIKTFEIPYLCLMIHSKLNARFDFKSLSFISVTTVEYFT